MTPTVTVKRLPKSRVECRAVFSADEVKGAETQALTTLSHHIDVPGFRKGKAPEHLVREKINLERLLDETVHLLLPSIVQSAAKEHTIVPIIPPSAQIESVSPLIVTLVFVERPKIAVKAGKISVEKKETKVSDADADKMIEGLLREHQTSTAVEREARQGDRLTIDGHGDDAQGNRIAGSELQGRPVVIGSKTLIPGFEDALIGLKKGESKAFPLKFPEKYHAPELQGKPVTFHITVKDIEELTSPKLTDAFAKEKFGVENADALRKRVREAMVSQEESIERQRREGALFESILKATSVELADELITDEMRNLVEHLAESLKEQGMTLEQWMEKTGKKPEEVEADMRKKASERLTLRFGIQQLIEEKKIAVTDEEMHQAVQALVADLAPEKRIEIAPLYAPGARNYEQLKWQTTVEKLMEELLK